MVKTYQLASVMPYGTLLKLAPITTDEELNKVTCLQLNGTTENRVQIQTILPDAKNFTLLGTENFLGFTCDKFRLEEVIGEKRNVYTLWVRYKKSPHYPAARQPIPVRYEMRGYNTLLGSHFDHYFLDYDSYEHDDIPNEVFELDDSEFAIIFLSKNCLYIQIVLNL